MIHDLLTHVITPFILGTLATAAMLAVYIRWIEKP